jgi:hypothetical protein
MVEDFARAQAALEAELVAGDAQRAIVFYRLRDVALAAQSFAAHVLDRSGVSIAPQSELDAALAELTPLVNSHVLAFLHAPPTRVIARGRAAAALVSALLDAMVGDGFAARGAP